MSRKNAKDEDYIPRQGNCKMTDSKRTGNKFTYKMACTGSDAGDHGRRSAVRHRRLRRQDADDDDGLNQAMQMTYSGKRIGSCTATAK